MSTDLYLRDVTQALRNIVRQRRRALFALVTIVGGVMAFLLAGGFIQWILQDMREATIRSQLGHVQIVRPGFFDKGLADPYAYLLSGADAVYDSFSKRPGVRVITPRLAFTGLASHDDATISFSGEGVDPDKEGDLSRALQIVSGEPLSSTEPKGIILGEGLAANIGVKVGDVIVLLATTSKGTLNAVECRVRGIFATITKAYDDTFLRVPLSVAKTLSRANGATSWVVLLDNTDDTDAFVEEARAKTSAKDFEFIPWHDLADFYNKTVQLFTRQVGVVKILIALIIVLSISNTLSMAVIERTGEIGTVMALGLRRTGVLRMFITEGAMLGIIGGLLGVTLGLIAASAISAVGIPMPAPPGMARGYIGQILITPGLIVEALTLAVFTTLVASILPAWKASRMNIVDALRHQR
ncbi:FtsX-like permease family protein [Zoogloea sp.]|uniref:ABC transporter permease n=1 Tax=Zoogloea sp. TaxID=49181 RepID=UPI001B602334|nr:FtsX-like permease family protein [Zoogloea sp.]MBK6656418.1 ABC transporter permease [Zoogloea sp.]MBK7845999.1 ABC transporter permease [Zoogloea sp.]MBP7443562.1 ABC transporter permease [Zoogloea sp.]HPH14401.1 ABC transporter permease [Burkholderiaceae bacterium]